MSEANKETTLECIPRIWYLVRFQKDQNDIHALLDSDSKVNAINPAYAKKLGLCIRQTNVRAQIIDRSHLNTFWIVIAGFLLQDKLGKV